MIELTYEPMDEAQVLEYIGDLDAFLKENHVVYSSDKHGKAYVAKDRVFPYVRKTFRLAAEIARRFKDDDVEVVVAPVVGGALLGQLVALHLSNMLDRDVLILYADKAPNKEFVLEREFDTLIVGNRTLAVEDVLNSGESVLKVVVVARSYGANVIGVAALCNRNNVKTSDLGDVPRLNSLINIQLEAWPAEECQLCADGVPVYTRVGKGKAFLAAQAARAAK